MEREIQIVNKLSEIDKVANFIEELCKELNLSGEITMKLNLALEEAVCNIIMYGYPADAEHSIQLKATLTENQLIFLLSDKGVSFNPTDFPDADINAPIEERAIGGLGIFLIRSIMNEVSYQRLVDENHLTMKKNL